jgi:hypothetical protein
MTVTKGNGQQQSEWQGVFLWADRGIGEVATCVAPVVSPDSGTINTPLRIITGTPLTFSVSPVGDTSNTKYNVFVVVEQIM